jgi:hypothetical protein
LLDQSMTDFTVRTGDEYVFCRHRLSQLHQCLCCSAGFICSAFLILPVNFCGA